MKYRNKTTGRIVEAVASVRIFTPTNWNSYSYSFLEERSLDDFHAQYAPVEEPNQ